jgi:hypothetical protein
MHITCVERSRGVPLTDGGQRNSRVGDLLGGPVEAQALARAIVEPAGDRVEGRFDDSAEVGAPREVPAQQAVDVLAGARAAGGRRGSQKNTSMPASTWTCGAARVRRTDHQARAHEVTLTVVRAAAWGKRGGDKPSDRALVTTSAAHGHNIGRTPAEPDRRTSESRCGSPSHGPAQSGHHDLPR